MEDDKECKVGQFFLKFHFKGFFVDKFKQKP